MWPFVLKFYEWLICNLGPINFPSWPMIKTNWNSRCGFSSILVEKQVKRLGIRRKIDRKRVKQDLCNYPRMVRNPKGCLLASRVTVLITASGLTFSLQWYSLLGLNLCRHYFLLLCSNNMRQFLPIGSHSEAPSRPPSIPFCIWINSKVPVFYSKKRVPCNDLPVIGKSTS